MRAVILIGAAVVAGLWIGGGGGSRAATGQGWLAGVTKISFGCPGPVREGGPTCDPWRPFAHARFSIRETSPIVGRPQIVVSDGGARFRLRLEAGAYALTPLPEAHTHGGPLVRVVVSAGAVSRVVVRFVGFPQMV